MLFPELGAHVAATMRITFNQDKRACVVSSTSKYMTMAVRKDIFRGM
jgi:hypothetical protein